uniref:Uncharacterized protein n=1 Tax=Anguilla anguilla TaxID=7936 RepID=A0A0E9W6T6_ANGAN
MKTHRICGTLFNSTTVCLPQTLG